MRASSGNIRLLALTVAVAIAWPGNVPADSARATPTAVEVDHSSAGPRKVGLHKPVFDAAALHAGCVVVDDRSDEADGDDGLDMPTHFAIAWPVPGAGAIDVRPGRALSRPSVAARGGFTPPSRLRC